ncbi:MAG: hypothetical protein V2A74_10800, partial [bacterium]
MCIRLLLSGRPSLTLSALATLTRLSVALALPALALKLLPHFFAFFGRHILETLTLGGALFVGHILEIAPPSGRIARIV